MTNSWWTYLKSGLSQKLPEDRIGGQEGYGSMRGSLKNLQNREWGNHVSFLCGRGSEIKRGKS